MFVIAPGHRYGLMNLKADGYQTLQFRQDGTMFRSDVQGTSCQEVIRALIDRVQELDAEMPWEGNQQIIHHGRQMLALFEARALLRKVEKGLEIEKLPTGPDGHLIFNGD